MAGEPKSPEGMLYAVSGDSVETNGDHVANLAWPGGLERPRGSDGLISLAVYSEMRLVSRIGLIIPNFSI